ncbi:MAG TPA: histidinol-phosphatase, partial [Candidatus Acetothermia bacterium]|nr:histidinol-phosphatase [Candidatus Acetothermia bacterium]
MNWFRADLHIHSVLSACASLEMSPRRIVTEARRAGL